MGHSEGSSHSSELSDASSQSPLSSSSSESSAGYSDDSVQSTPSGSDASIESDQSDLSEASGSSASEDLSDASMLSDEPSSGDLSSGGPTSDGYSHSDGQSDDDSEDDSMMSSGDDLSSEVSDPSSDLSEQPSSGPPISVPPPSSTPPPDELQIKVTWEKPYNTLAGIYAEDTLVTKPGKDGQPPITELKKKGDIYFAAQVFAKVQILKDSTVMKEYSLHQKAISDCATLPDDPKLNVFNPNDVTGKFGEYIDYPSATYAGPVPANISQIKGSFTGEVKIVEKPNIRNNWGFTWVVDLNRAAGTATMTVRTDPP
ncbi:MAG: hypothetical protein NTV80_03195 [Verrucomicrobia bacterium]|nr:hypothetical protein [Verrucomicrobiota bacterium]